MTTESKAKYEQALVRVPEVGDHYKMWATKNVSLREDEYQAIRAALVAQIARLDREASGGVSIEALKRQLAEPPKDIMGIVSSIQNSYDKGWNACLDHLQSIGALAGGVLTGWKLVPIEATGEMMKAPYGDDIGRMLEARYYWDIMVARTPAAPNAGEVAK